MGPGTLRESGAEQLRYETGFSFQESLILMDEISATGVPLHKAVNLIGQLIRCGYKFQAIRDTFTFLRNYTPQRED